MPTSFHTTPVPLRERTGGVRGRVTGENREQRQLSEGESWRDSEGKRKQKGGDGSSLKINPHKCFLKSALMQSICRNKRSSRRDHRRLSEHFPLFASTHIHVCLTNNNLKHACNNLWCAQRLCDKMGEWEENVCSTQLSPELWTAVI